MPAAANIDEAIQFGPFNIAAVSADPGKSLLTQLDAWITPMYRKVIFPNTETRAVRNVTDWAAPTYIARAVVAAQGAGNLDTNEVAVACVLDAVNRSLWAVKIATNLGYITGAQQTAVVAAYNAAWA